MPSHFSPWSHLQSKHLLGFTPLDLHKVRVDKENQPLQDLLVMSDETPKNNGCRKVLMLHNLDKKKIFTMFFYNSGVVLGQGEYWKFYKDNIFPLIIKQLPIPDDDTNGILQMKSPSLADDNVPTSPAKLQETVDARLQQLRKHQSPLRELRPIIS